VAGVTNHGAGESINSTDCSRERPARVQAIVQTREEVRRSFSLHQMDKEELHDEPEP
jgi:hypothetical protein